jgi:hypothetical protein
MREIMQKNLQNLGGIFIVLIFAGYQSLASVSHRSPLEETDYSLLLLLVQES